MRLRSDWCDTGRLFGLIGGHHSQERAPTQAQEEQGHAEPTEEHMATDDILHEPALQSSIVQERAAAIEGQAAAIEGQAAGRDGSSKEAFATEDVLKEPLLESGAAQQAAAAEEGKTICWLCCCCACETLVAQHSLGYGAVA